MPTSTPENNNATAGRPDKAVVCDALVSLGTDVLEAVMREVDNLRSERAALLEAIEYTVSVDKIMRPDVRHVRLEELLALANIRHEPRPTE